MKKIFDFAMIIGFIMIAGGAGGYENMNAGFGVSFVIMLFGAVLMWAGASGKEKYKKYMRRCLRRNKNVRKTVKCNTEKMCREVA